MLAGHGGLISDSGLICGFGSHAWDFNDNISIQEFKVENARAQCQPGASLRRNLANYQQF